MGPLSWLLSFWQLQRVPSVQDLDKSGADVRCNPGRNSPATTAVRIGQGWRRNITSINIAVISAHIPIFTISIIANSYFFANWTILYIYTKCTPSFKAWKNLAAPSCIDAVQNYLGAFWLSGNGREPSKLICSTGAG
jgi:hypothetical protein